MLLRPPLNAVSCNAGPKSQIPTPPNDVFRTLSRVFQRRRNAVPGLSLRRLAKVVDVSIGDRIGSVCDSSCCCFKRVCMIEGYTMSNSLIAS